MHRTIIEELVKFMLVNIVGGIIARKRLSTSSDELGGEG